MTNKLQDFHDRCVNVGPLDLFEYRDVIPEFAALEACPQDPGWHAEGNVLIHLNMTGAEARELCKEISDPWTRTSLHIAALLHDVGKPGTTFKNEKSGRIVAYGHEQYGVHIAREFLTKYFPEFTYEQRDDILNLIEYHGHPKRLASSESSVERYRRLSWEVPCQDVYNIEIADFRGRKANDVPRNPEILELFKQQATAAGVFGQRYEIPGTEKFPKLAKNILTWWVLLHHEDGNREKLQQEALVMADKPPFKLILPVGCPASGKSTNRPNNIKIISMDDERHRLCGTPNDMSKNQEVFDNCFRELVKSVKIRQDVYWDATSWTRKARRRLIDLARDNGATVEIVWYDIPLATLLERNKLRDKQVPEDILIKFFKGIESPRKYEYDNLIVIR